MLKDLKFNKVRTGKHLLVWQAGTLCGMVGKHIGMVYSVKRKQKGRERV